MQTDSEESDQWLSISDLMSALMVIFLLFSILLVYAQSQKTKNDISSYENEVEKQKLLAESYESKSKSLQAQAERYDRYVRTRDAIHRDLNREFNAEELQGWGAKIVGLSVTFHDPNVLFAEAEADLQPRYKAILDDFFLRFVRVLEPYKDDIEEIRIEGHTSSDWLGKTGNAAYFENMRLSQNRSRETLKYVLVRVEKAVLDAWLRNKMVAVGLSSSRLIKDGGQEDRSKSRRVNFRVLTSAGRTTPQ